MRRFPLWLSLAAAVVFAVLIRLGVWQLDRRAHTRANQARIEALRGAPARPLAAVLAGSGDLDHRRVAADCAAPARAAPEVFRYALPGGRIGWRLLGLCPLAAARYDVVLVDRGLVTALAGAMAPRPTPAPPPSSVVGVLRVLGQKPLFSDTMDAGTPGLMVVRVLDRPAVTRIARGAGFASPAPYALVAERETPVVPGLAPAPVTEDVPRDNFGYALTWFGLAAALAGVYGAFLWRRMRP